jgi:hypothetical protein
MTYLAAALFRVRLEIVNARELRTRLAVAGPFNLTLYVVASDAESAAAAARSAASLHEAYAPECVRAVSVKFIERVNVLAPATSLPHEGHPGPRPHRTGARQFR